MNKKERLNLIRKIIEENEIETQNELVRLLKDEGLVATQATISRDINEIGITKLPNSEHRYVYSLPNKVSASNSTYHLAVQSIKMIRDPHPQIPCLFHLDVVPGNTRLMKRMITESFANQLYSIVADDDSIQVVAVSDTAALDMIQQIKQWMN